MPARIDDLRARGVLVLHVDDAVVGVDVPMEHICGLIFVQQVVEAFEAGVGPAALHVAVAFCGGVGNEDVEAAGQRDLGLDLEDAGLHVLLGVHVDLVVGGAAAVFDGAAEAQEADAVELVDAVLDAFGAEGRVLDELVVVVAADVDHGDVDHGHEEVQVIGIEVAAGHNELHAFDTFFAKEIVE